MRIPEHIIDQVREQANIVDVIGEHVRLKQSGKSFTGLCPFHKEKTPSFHVNPERGMYKCFGCGKAGNVITFVTEYQHLGFVDAVQSLATRMGIVIPEADVSDPTGIIARKESAYRALRAASEFFAHTLGTPEGKVARLYFAKRGFDDDTIAAFALGASAGAWDALMLHLRGSGYTDEHLVDAGLVVAREDNRMYDRFRGRAMFTIRDAVGRVVGFSARVLSDDPSQPKYINSPQSIVFEKSRVLYGLDLAKRAISEHRRAILVEGQSDVVSLHQSGFKASVASSGTALTREHVELLKKYADTIVVVFDADNAGQNATTKAIELILQAGLDPRIVVLPSGSDPDAYIRDEGPEAFGVLIDAHVSFIEYQSQRFRSLGELDDAVSQARAVRFMLTWISGVPDVIRHPFLVRELAEHFRLDENVLLRELQQITTGSRREGIGTSARQNTPARLTVTQELRKTTFVGLLPPERELISIALTAEHGLALLGNKYLISDETFISETGRRIFSRIVVLHEEHAEVIQHIVNDEVLSPDERRLVADIAFGIQRPSERWLAFDVEIPDRNDERMIRDAVLGMRIVHLDRHIDDLSRIMDGLADVDERERLMYRISQCIIKREHTRRLFDHNTEDLEWLQDDTLPASSSSA